MNKFPFLSRLGVFRPKGIKTVCLLLALAFFTPGLFSQDAQPAGDNSQAGAAETQAAPASSAVPAASAEPSGSTGAASSAQPASSAEAAESAASASTESADLQPVDRGAPPEALRRPERGEAPRYPQDIVIGELGQGKAPEAAYRYALKLIQTLMTGSKDDANIKNFPLILTDALLDEINSLEPRTYRIGGGRVEDDGNVSFLVRFLGQDESITGEMFLRQESPPAPAAASAAASSTASAPADTSGSQTAPDAPVASGSQAAPDTSAASASQTTPDASAASASQTTPDASAASDSQIAPDAPAASDSQGTSAAAAPPADSKWLLDDLILEDKVNLNDIKDSYRYDFSPYERLY